MKDQKDEKLPNLREIYFSILYTLGAGSAGAVIANRLSEDENVTVLLLEAGGSELDHNYIKVPLATPLLQETDIDWSYYTIPQKASCKAMKEQRSYWPRGRVLGGTSSINHMVYIRGSRHDYDQWEKEGVVGWGYTDVLPYFLKIEDMKIVQLSNSTYHSTGGYLPITESKVTDLSNLYQRAAEELGYKVVDQNGEDMIGFSYVQSNIFGGERFSTSTAYIRPIINRSNLHISTNSFVTKILITNKTARGIEMIKNGQKRILLARKEVILSAGAVNSPQLLMLSGIGPREHLEEHKVTYRTLRGTQGNICIQVTQRTPTRNQGTFIYSRHREHMDEQIGEIYIQVTKRTCRGTQDNIYIQIEVHADLPVGENMEDHPMFFMKYNTKEDLSISVKSTQSWWNMLQYYLTRGGIFSFSGMEAIIFDKSRIKDMHTLYPDYQLMFFSIALDKAFLENGLPLNYNDSVVKVAQTRAFSNEFTITQILLHPKSTGSIKLKSKDPFVHPVIDPNYLSNHHDIDIFIEAIRKTQELAKSKALRELDATLNRVDFPGICDEEEFDSDTYWECLIRHYAVTVYHPSCTCRMGDKDDPTAVVDSKLRVKGIANLRVADASVMRHVTSGNTNSPSIMIGEKAADLIRGKDTVMTFRKQIKHLKP
ncbi:Glucose dehydrogenase [FAD, quinone],Choline dehydrogenase, mitochondrial,Oxygen-dependent choline dehydrogenase [Mytilus coruscus]|uniref:Glucose dehydrogenase [FAD, quinone],Choline dehydrogenase, mitochondrial,Oxygen-dependent choline dehydrogenase n=1 Tax=Mytilus coruscus TaxID=42192 RepID=A0A6J8B2T8_MYTCO|nr:Glucose dehydrogenase [FAD, quinone],Choline dehydrogenase, mitochondrial,Oxygen-dependent choline dehydrogenase [Mytilus coruscus]